MIAFEKMHGNGNDFVVIDALTSNIAFPKALVKRMAHRKLGVGFDQLIVIYPPKKKQDDFFVKFFNADGSQADMCMNGLRCVAYFIWENKLAPKKVLNLGTKTKGIKAIVFLLCASANNLPFFSFAFLDFFNNSKKLYSLYSIILEGVFLSLSCFISIS